MLRLAHPVRGGQEAPARRKGRHAPSLSLTPDEVRHTRAALRNVARTFGGLGKLAAALGVAPFTLTRKEPPSAGLAVALARLSGMSVDAVLGRVQLAAVPSPAATTTPPEGPRFERWAE